MTGHPGERLALTSIARWFAPETAPEDHFVKPNFNWGQFFYTADTARRLVRALDHYRHPLCLCTPRLAAEWHRLGRVVELLDIDSRFNSLPGFRYFDLNHPWPLPGPCDAIVFDPLFQDAPSLRRAIDVVLTNHEDGRPDLFLTFPVERQRELVETFAEFDLRRLDFPLRYNNIKDGFQTLLALYGSNAAGF